MFVRTIRQFQKLVREHYYVMTTHAQDEMDEDDLSILDVESAILSGRIMARQRDIETNEWKYLIQGEGLSLQSVRVVAKLSSVGRLVIITVYRG